MLGRGTDLSRGGGASSGGDGGGGGRSGGRSGAAESYEAFVRYLDLEHNEFFKGGLDHDRPETRGHAHDDGPGADNGRRLDRSCDSSDVRGPSGVIPQGTAPPTGDDKDANSGLEEVVLGRGEESDVFGVQGISPPRHVPPSLWPALSDLLILVSAFIIAWPLRLLSLRLPCHPDLIATKVNKNCIEQSSMQLNLQIECDPLRPSTCCGYQGGQLF